MAFSYKTHVILSFIPSICPKWDVKLLETNMGKVGGREDENRRGNLLF